MASFGMVVFLLSCWVFLLAPVLAQVTEQCIEDEDRLNTDLGRIFIPSYAIAIYDSFATKPGGLVTYNPYWAGYYDQCESSSTALVEDGVERFRGRYCSMNLESFVPGYPEIWYGACVISSCVDNSTDLTQYAEKWINSMPWASEYQGGLVNGIKARYGYCSSEQPYTAADYAAIVICSILVVIVIGGTTLDIIIRKKKREQKAHHQNGLQSAAGSTDPMIPAGKTSTGSQGVLTETLLSFSWLTNGERLLSTDVHPGLLPCLNGIRVMSTWWIVLGHNVFFMVTYLQNVGVVTELSKKFGYQAIYNSGLGVDSFFCMGGFLVAYLALKELNRSGGRKDWLLFYFHRFFRLTPIYMFVIMLTCTLYLHLPQGPRFYDLIGLADGCNKYWWTNLVYINNIVHREACIGWTWYLGMDMQLFVISPIFIYLLYRKPKIGVSLCVLMMLASTSAITAIPVVYDTQPLAILNKPEGYTQEEKGNWFYYYPGFRLSPYFVGILTGYFLNQRKLKLSMPKWVAIIGWIVAIAVNGACSYGVYKYNHESTYMPQDLATAYDTLFRLGWAVSLAWVMIACLTGNGGFINTMLSWGMWQPLGKLTYLVYLLHPLVMLYYNATTRVMPHLTTWSYINYFLAHLCVTHVIAIVLALTVEMPMFGLEKIAVQALTKLGVFRSAKKRVPETQKPQVSPMAPSAPDTGASVHVIMAANTEATDGNAPLQTDDILEKRAEIHDEKL